MRGGIGPRVLLRRLREVMAEHVSPQERLDRIVRLIASNMVAEVKKRYAGLPTKPYSGFVQPKLVAVKDANGQITDVKVEWETDFVKQMLRYGKEYAFLPVFN